MGEQKSKRYKKKELGRSEVAGSFSLVYYGI
jgi:hypothetical protein